MKKIHRFLTTENLSDHNNSIKDKDLVHIIKNVLKFDVGEICIFFFDGSEDYLSEITEIKKDSVSFRTISKIPKKNIPKNITACISITKRDTFEIVVQKLTEIGVNKIIPILSGRTVKQALKIDRLQKISEEALEQSGGSNVVNILDPISLEECLNQTKDMSCIYFDIEGEKYQKQDLKELAFYIGPEGGWNDEDKALFSKYNVKSYKLGETVLRAETASIVCGYKLLWD
ncbi:16S rRNA (uracil(1498)-N(3))-methyltransferase [Candidatus Nomurabacteria bacterium]|nr:16S rRNA (uracil(1498)-N(3))-methyltransferase [Candidatus Nomurabacteria bacterium]